MTTIIYVFVIFISTFINFCDGFIGGFGGGGGGGGFGYGGGGGGFGYGGCGGGIIPQIGGCFIPPPILPCCNPCCFYGYGNINPGMNFGFNPLIPPFQPYQPFPSFPQYPQRPGYRGSGNSGYPSFPNYPNYPPPKCNSGNCGIPPNQNNNGCKCVEECQCCKSNSNPSPCIKNIVFPCPKQQQQNGCGCNK